MIELTIKQTQSVCGAQYFTPEEIANTNNNWGLTWGVGSSASCGGLAYAYGINPIASIALGGAGAVLGYMFGYSQGAEMNRDPNSNVLYGVFVDTIRR